MTDQRSEAAGSWQAVAAGERLRAIVGAANWPEVRRIYLAIGATSERLQRIVRGNWLAAAGQFWNGTACAYYLWGKVRGDILLVWYASVLMVVGLLIASAIRNQPRSPRPMSSRSIMAICRGSLVAALPWGLLAFATIYMIPESARMVPYGVVAGMSAGGAMMLGAIPVASFVYLTVIIAPMIITSILFAHGAEAVFSMSLALYAFMLFVFCGHLSSTMWINESSEQSLRTRMDDLTRAHDEIAAMARTDSITGLANRRSFTEIVQARMSEVGDETDGVLPVAVIDLDHFKVVNDTYGHDVGDIYLRRVGERLVAALPEGWLAARIGGDEFAVAGDRPISEADAIAIGRRLIDEVKSPFTIEQRQFRAGCSIGMAFAPTHSRCVNEILKLADHALISVKSAGRGKVALVDLSSRPDMEASAAEGQMLAEAIRSGGISIHYQPKYSIESRRIIGLETVIRWRHPAGHLVFPRRLLEIAEANGLVLELLQHALSLVAQGAERLTRELQHVPKLALNAHRATLRLDSSAVHDLERIAAVLKGRDRIVVEVTEDSLVGRGCEEAPILLDRLSKKGFEICLDQFGIGLSSLRLVRDLPLSEIKISRRCVAALETSRRDRDILAGVADIADRLGIRIVADGVQTIDHEECLTRLGISYAQGGRFSEPLTLDDAISLIRRVGLEETETDQRRALRHAL